MRKAILTAGMIATGMLWATGPAHADLSAQEVDRFTVIAGGWQLEQHCNHLDESSHAELGEIAAHAEIEVAQELGPDKVREIMDAARAFGDERGGECGSQTREEVLLSLTLAQDYAGDRAMVAAVTPQDEAPAAETREETPAATQPRQQRRRRANRDMAALNRYGEQTQAYYLQRRCGHLAYRQDYHFWELIAHQHHVMVQLYGGRAVKRMQREAEANANSASVVCGSRTRREVNAGYAAIRADLSQN